MKHRSYAITIQNVEPPKAYDWLKEYTTNPQVKEYSYSVEPYNHQEGHHLHLFVQYMNQKHIPAVLKEINKLKPKFLALRPEGEERDWGRLWLQPQKGKLEECTAYLQGETKSKLLGEVYSGNTKLCRRRHRWKEAKNIGRYKKGMMEEFCGLCSRSDCKGCCKGCMFCDKNDNFYTYAREGFSFEEIVNHQDNWLNRQRKKCCI